MNSDTGTLPDGLSEADVGRGQRPSAGASPASLVVLGLVLAIGLSGFLGERRVVLTSTAGGAASVSLRIPAVIRTGSMFEASLEVVAQAPIDELSIAFSPGVWEGMTLNTITPAAHEERYSEESFVFLHGRLPAGQRFRMKIEAQINPSRFGRNRGQVLVRDGNRELASLTALTWILP